MAQINIIDGDFPEGVAHYLVGRLYIKQHKKHYFRSAIALQEISTITFINTNEYHTRSGIVAWCIVGAIALGPLGLFAGYFLSKHKTKTNVIFEITFKNGTSFIAYTNSSIYLQLKNSIDHNSQAKPNTLPIQREPKYVKHTSNVTDNINTPVNNINQIKKAIEKLPPMLRLLCLFTLFIGNLFLWFNLLDSVFKQIN